MCTRKRDLQDVCTVRVMRGAECGSDHRLVRGKLKLHVRRKTRSQGIKFPKRIDVSRLRDMSVRKELQEALESEQFDSTWDQFRTKIYKTCVKTLGLKKRKHRDWFDENDHQINTLLKKQAVPKVSRCIW